jgi:type 1 glutamine amidotransferase
MTTRSVALLLALAATASAQPRPAPKRLLVVTVTKGFQHKSIYVAVRVLEELAQQSKAFTLDYAGNDAELAAKMAPKALERYDGVVFASTTGELPLPDKDGFLAWLGRGHGFVGIHAATDTFHGWPPYVEMIGGEFKTHGPQVTVSPLVEDKEHPATKGITFPDVFDEIYEFKSFEKGRVHTLLYMDKHPQSKAPGFYPLAWTREHANGRVFYTALGHREDVLQQPWYREHLLGGIRWALDAPPAARR